jgi:hypothetical protein
MSRSVGDLCDHMLPVNKKIKVHKHIFFQKITNGNASESRTVHHQPWTQSRQFIRFCIVFRP